MREKMSRSVDVMYTIHNTVVTTGTYGTVLLYRYPMS